MKRFFSTSSLKAVMVGVVISGMATACQNGSNNPIGGFLPSEENSAANTASTKASGTAAQSDEERKREQARKIAEFLAKPEVKEMSAGLEEIAQAVAVAVEDKALTQRIYEKSMEKFDGATNVLWMHLEADSKLKASGGWNKRINDVLSKSKRNVQNVDAAIKKFEKTVGAPLHLYWVNAEAWDKKTTPLVAFVPFDVNPKTRTSIPAFDSKGNRVELGKDGALAKQRPVIVVNVNERTELGGKIKDNLFIAKDIGKIATGQVAGRSINGVNIGDIKDKNIGSQAQSTYTLKLTNVWFSTSVAWDELPWDGPSEFYCYGIQHTAQVDPSFPGGFYFYDEIIGGLYMGNMTTGVNHSRNDIIGYGSVGTFGNSVRFPNGFVTWWEDDFLFPDPLADHGYPVPCTNYPGSDPEVGATYTAHY